MNEYDQKRISGILDEDGLKLGDIKKLAKSLKTDHEFSLLLWANSALNYRLLAVLIMDKKQLTENIIRTFITDLDSSSHENRTQITDWLLANQLMKDKKLINIMLAWQYDELSLLRRLYWYYQARLRWMGKIPLDNAEYLLVSAEKDMMNETLEVQWAINYCVAQIGVFDSDYRTRCIALGKKTELYKNDVVAKGCTLSYLPDFISIQVSKNKLK